MIFYNLKKFENAIKLSENNFIKYFTAKLYLILFYFLS